MQRLFESSHPTGGRRLFHAAIVFMLAAFLLVVWQRRALRAAWWARQLESATAPADLAYYSAAIESCGADATGAVARLARSDRQHLRVAAMIILGRLPGAAAAAELKRGLSDGDETVRVTAAVNLGVRHAASIQPEIAALARRAPAQTGAACVLAMERMPDAAIATALRELAEDRSLAALVRAQAIESLGRRRDPTAVPTLVALLGDAAPSPARLPGDVIDEQFVQRFARSQPLATRSSDESASDPTMADRAAAALTRITGQDCGYRPGLSDAQLQPILACWRTAATRPADDFPTTLPADLLDSVGNPRR